VPLVHPTKRDVFDKAKDLDIHPFILINFFVETITYQAGDTPADNSTLTIVITNKKIGEIIEDVFPTDASDIALGD